MAKKLTFVRTQFNKEANNGLGEVEALFVNGDSDLAKAFKSASGAQGLSTMGGVVTMNVDQINHRIDQLKDRPELKETVEQLEHGRTAIQAKLSAKPGARQQAMTA